MSSLCKFLTVLCFAQCYFVYAVCKWPIEDQTRWSPVVEGLKAKSADVFVNARVGMSPAPESLTRTCGKLKQGSIVLRLPADAIFSAKDCFPSQGFKSSLSPQMLKLLAGLDQGFSDHVKTAMCLYVHRIVLREQSAWWFWIQTLPSHHHMSLFFTSKQLKVLNGTSGRQFSRAIRHSHGTSKHLLKLQPATHVLARAAHNAEFREGLLSNASHMNVAAVEGCYEAHVTDFSPSCSAESYLAAGYTCKGLWCSAPRCLSSACHSCAFFLPGYIHHPDEGRCKPPPVTAATTAAATTAAATSTAVSPVCYEAYRRSFSNCSYEGYFCVGQWCAANECVNGECNRCAVQQEGRELMRAMGRCVESAALLRFDYEFMQIHSLAYARVFSFRRPKSAPRHISDFPRFVFVPLGEMFNHAGTHNLDYNWVMHQGKLYWELRTNRDISAGDELTVSYGRGRCSTDMVSSYGFILPFTPRDYAIVIDLVPQVFELSQKLSDSNRLSAFCEVASESFDVTDNPLRQKLIEIARRKRGDASSVFHDHWTAEDVAAMRLASTPELSSYAVHRILSGRSIESQFILRAALTQWCFSELEVRVEAFTEKPVPSSVNEAEESDRLLRMLVHSLSLANSEPGDDMVTEAARRELLILSSCCLHWQHVISILLPSGPRKERHFKHIDVLRKVFLSGTRTSALSRHFDLFFETPLHL